MTAKRGLRLDNQIVIIHFAPQNTPRNDRKKTFMTAKEPLSIPDSLKVMTRLANENKGLMYGSHYGYI